MWVKGQVKWQGREVLNDNKKWHGIIEDGNYLYIDGKVKYRITIISKNRVKIIKENE
jgi:hypothetical protein